MCLKRLCPEIKSLLINLVQKYMFFCTRKVAVNKTDETPAHGIYIMPDI